MAVFCLFSLAAAYTHYYALLSVAFFYAALLPVAAWKKNGFIKKVLLLYLAAFIGYLPWFFVLLSTFQRTSSSFWLTAIPSYKEALLFLFQSSWGAKLFWAFLLTVLFYFLYESGLFRMTIGKRRVDFSFFLRKMKLDAEEIWIASGMISVLGTIAVGELVSRGIRPMFQTSYIYPVASVAWLILAVCAGRFRPGRLWLMVLTLAVLLSGVPQYISVCHREKAVDQATASFLATVPAERGDVIWTDISHLDWTLLDHYYPDVEHHLLEEDVALPETDGAGRDWLFLREPMDMEAGEDFSFWAEGKLGTSEDIYVYQSP